MKPFKLDESFHFKAIRDFLKSFTGSFSMIFAAFSIATAHLFAYFYVLSDSMRQLVDASSISSVSFTLFGSIAVASLLGFLTFPVLIMLFSLIRKVPLLGLPINFVSEKAKGDNYGIKNSVMLRVYRVFLQFSFFSFIYLGLVRGLVAVGMAVVLAIIIFLLFVVFAAAELYTDGDVEIDDIDEKGAKSIVIAIAPAAAVAVVLTMSFIIGVHRSFYVLESSQPLEFQLTDLSTVDRPIFLSTSSGVIVYKYEGVRLPVVLPWSDETSSIFEFFPYEVIGSIKGKY